MERKVNEALGRNTGEQKKMSNAERMRQIGLQNARVLNDVSEFFDEQIGLLKRYFPELKQVNSDSGFYIKDKEPAYYIKDNGHMALRMNLDSSNIGKFAEFLSNQCIIVDELVGDVDISNDKNFQGFPPKFPQTVMGNLRMFNLAGLKNMDNAPKRVTGEVDIDKKGIASRENSKSGFISQALDMYQEATQRRLDRMKLVSVFPSRQNKTNESLSFEGHGDVNESSRTRKISNKERYRI